MLGRICRGRDGMTLPSPVRWLVPLCEVALLGGCVTLTSDPRAVISGPDGMARVSVLRCDATDRALENATDGPLAEAVQHRPIRVLSWNIHKQGDAGWDRDLSQFVGPSDVVLLQEAVLQPPLRRILDASGLHWVMASSFLYGSEEFGVLTATRVVPLASCTLRATEPLIRIPKSSVISWLRLAGTRDTLAIVNVHAINFDLGLDAYRAQLEAVADALAGHRGPIIFGGDFNTWSDARDALVHEAAVRLGLTELVFQTDRRTLFFGRHLDHVFTRGLELSEFGASPVTSSDHNPLTATLRLP